MKCLFKPALLSTVLKHLNREMPTVEKKYGVYTVYIKMTDY